MHLFLPLCGVLLALVLISCVTSSQPAPGWQANPAFIAREEAKNPAGIYREDRVPDYTLPITRTLADGTAITTAEDWEAASVAGIDVQRTYLITFALGAALAGVAGTLVSIQYSIAPSIGIAWTLKALVVVVLAGLGSIFGAFAAGLLLGVAEQIAVFFVGASYREVVGLVLFLLVLVLRPQGLFGRAR